jgi:hypothetical protein
MVLRRDQAEATVMKHLDIGYPAFMVQVYISRIVQRLYAGGHGLALMPLESGYAQLSGNDALSLILQAARAIGLNPQGKEAQIAAGIAKLNSAGYQFVRRVA